MAKLIVYGDVHGCLDELIVLRKKIGIEIDDIEVCAGDFITRGANSVETLKYLRKKAIYCVRGNHEDKIIRYIKHSKSKSKNPIKLDKDEKNIIKTMSLKDIRFLESLPLYLQFGNYTIVHGGLQNSMDLSKLSPEDESHIMRMRYLDKDAQYVRYGKEDSNSIFWAEVYNGENGFVLYGHNKFKEPKINKYAIGLDTGCVYGNVLTAVIIENDIKRFESVRFGER